ncbi:hypothetical protein Tcan_08260 [Toxocara canis]|uniref:Uncharacterized protein n=1 Tax=Toxocara canis TaxID=6265 RepID=A0A0B2V4W9_TOXCA|nr:hypothetical protein Tcan_08260 [Toxocara canis]
MISMIDAAAIRTVHFSGQNVKHKQTSASKDVISAEGNVDQLRDPRNGNADCTMLSRTRNDSCKEKFVMLASEGNTYEINFSYFFNKAKKAKTKLKHETIARK